MTQLFRRAANREITPLTESPFASETADLEEFLKGSPELFGNAVSIVAQQVDTGASGILDLLAVDRESKQIIVYELKNVPADVHALLQVLRYGSWAKNNPDSLRYLLLKHGEQDVDAFDFVTIRLALVAPEIREDALELAQYVAGFEFEFIELSRFADGDERIVAVSRRTPPSSAAASARAQEEWGWDKYVSDLGVSQERADLGRVLLEKLEAAAHERGWNLRTFFRKGYTPLQTPSTYNVMGTQDYWRTGWAIWFKLPEEPAKLGLDIPSYVEQRHWDQGRNQIYMNFLSSAFDIQDFDEFMDRAYDFVQESGG